MTDITIRVEAACPLRMFLDGMEVFGERFVDHGDWWELLPDRPAQKRGPAHGQPFRQSPAGERPPPRRKGGSR